MAGPGSQQLLQKLIPPGEAQVQFTAESLAWRVLNFEPTPEGTLRNVKAPTPYETIRWVGDTNYRVGDPEPLSTPLRGIYHASLMGGASDMLIVSAGSTLQMHQGWSMDSSAAGRSNKFVEIKTGLTSVSDTTFAGEARYPDQFVTLNDNIIWTNGIDRPLVIRPDGEVFDLGFAETPSPPMVEGPVSVPQDRRHSFYPNSHGYSWPGKVGTAGDGLAGDGGGVLTGHFVYHAQLEDVFGNRSATSLPSNAAYITSHRAQPLRGDASGTRNVTAPHDNTLGTEISDLTVQFLLRYSPPTASNAVAVWLYRTPDIDNVGVTPRFLARIPMRRQFFYSDNTSDAELGSDMVPTIPTPLFKLMCTHQGRLVVANVAGDPGIVRRSLPGQPGTFPSLEFIYPDSGGSEVTAITSHGGALLAFTGNSVYSLEEFGSPRPLAQGIGCIAPNSVKAQPDGTLIWLGADGFYALKGGAISRISRPIERILTHRLNTGRLVTAQAYIDPATGEYRCAVAPRGTSANRLILCFDGSHWREMDIGVHVASWARTKDYRGLALFLGCHAGLADMKASDYNSRSDRGTKNIYFEQGPSVYVMNRETANSHTSGFEVSYRSGWMRADENALTPVHVRTMYLGLLDAEDEMDYSIRFFRNGSWDPVTEMQSFLSVGVDDGSKVAADTGEGAIMGEAKAHMPRLYWRQVPVGLENANTWAFEISGSYDGDHGRINLAAFAFEISTATTGNTRSRIPLKQDE